VRGVKPDPVDLLIGSVKIYSPSSDEERYASFLEDAMNALGYSDVRRDSAGNVLGDVGHGSVNVLLCGHMDTVPGELPVRRTRGMLFGRGAADAKAPLCALLVAGARSADAGVGVTFAGVTREETDSLGILTIIKNDPKFHYAIFGEPSGAGRLTVGYRGRIGMHVQLTGGGGHAGAPWANANAFDKFLELLDKLRELESEHLVQGDHFNSLSISPTIVSAGSHHNVLPSACEATLDVRLPPGLSSSEAIASVRRVVSQLGADRVKVVVKFDEATEAYEAPRGSILIRAFQRAIIMRLKSRPVLTKKTGTGDMNTFASGTPAVCVTYGPGLSAASHTEDESVEIRDYLDSIDVLTEAIIQLGSLTV
jgi:LysW-gamma-L-lysine carboxypeptidase